MLEDGLVCPCVLEMIEIHCFIKWNFHDGHAEVIVSWFDDDIVVLDNSKDSCNEIVFKRIVLIS